MTPFAIISGRNQIDIWIRIIGLVLVLGLAAFPGTGVSGGAMPGKKRNLAQEMLEPFDKLTPAARFQLLEKLDPAGKAIQAAVRDDLALVILERGALEADQTIDLVCKVKSHIPSGIASRIKWVVDDGSLVKKGDKLMELDHSHLQEILRDRKMALDEALSSKAQAAEEFKIIARENQVNIKLEEISAQLAELEFEKYTGKDPLEKEALKLRVLRARLLVDRARLAAQKREKQAQVDLKVKTAIAETQSAMVREAEEELKTCLITAPKEGLVLYHVDPKKIVAPGEVVKEGQKLLTLWDGKHLLAVTRIHEAFISRVKKGQKATVRVDAFPGKILLAQVQGIANRAMDWVVHDVKVYPVQLAMLEDMPALKPGMSVEVRIEVDRKKGVVQIPVQALWRKGREHYCFVKVGPELHKRRVIPGLGNERMVEIVSGLKEGESVLRDPLGLLRRLPAKPGAFGPKTPGSGTRIHLVNVFPGEPVQKYGLTYQDVKDISSLAGAHQVVPVRRFLHVIQYRDRLHSTQVIGATPDLADLFSLQTETGRFLSTGDAHKNVAVLGGRLAKTLFPDQDAVGKMIVAGKHGYCVVGVLLDQAPIGGAPLDVNNSVFLPLSTTRAFFGNYHIIRQPGSRRLENVQLTDLYVTVAEPRELGTVLDGVRSLLGKTHLQKDWKMQVEG